MNCEKLSPNALKIFEEIKKYYPSDSRGNSLWREEGLINDNGWYDLKTKKDRDELIKKLENIIGYVIVLSARSRKDNNENLTKTIFNFRAERRWIEISVLLYELNFQIETMDFIES